MRSQGRRRRRRCGVGICDLPHLRPHLRQLVFVEPCRLLQEEVEGDLESIRAIGIGRRVSLLATESWGGVGARERVIYSSCPSLIVRSCDRCNGGDAAYSPVRSHQTPETGSSKAPSPWWRSTPPRSYEFASRLMRCEKKLTRGGSTKPSLGKGHRMNTEKWGSGGSGANALCGCLEVEGAFLLTWLSTRARDCDGGVILVAHHPKQRMFIGSGHRSVLTTPESDSEEL